MSCNEWKNDWVARLYDELEPNEQVEMDRHLDGCVECRSTLDRLANSSRLLRESVPATPAIPRVVVLETRRTWPVVWAFAAGAACALVVFGIGLMLGPQLNPALMPIGNGVQASGPATGGTQTAATHDRPVGQVYRQDMQAIERRLAALETLPASVTLPLTDEQLRQSLDQLERRFSRARSQDLDYLMQSITASEMRTGQWLDQTHDALNLLALRQDPRFSEQ